MIDVGLWISYILFVGAVAGMAVKGETVVDTADAVSVTYPGFINDFRKIGADISLLSE